MKLHLSEDSNSLAADAAKWISTQINETLARKDFFTLVLSGGSTPEKLYRILAASPYKEEIEWQKVHVFWGDERFVPFSDERNNAKNAFETLLNFVPVPKDQIHVMKTEGDPELAAAEYEEILFRYFGRPAHNANTSGSMSTFDLTLMGIGDDAHTLSLFPGKPVVHEKNKWVDAFYLDSQEMYRITLTEPVVSKSSKIAFLVSGANKAAALDKILNGSFNPDKYPSQLFRKSNGDVHWFIDKPAAAQLSF
ncbi:MAG TPA: 6-phosphogluconolactonase [Parasegetibacter sp.]